jgi:transcriptional regulator with PAS, ATPase and Fis domain
MVSRSPEMKAIFAVLPEVAESTATVLIEGESGTGKELVARSLHELSPRRAAPFVAINCSALPDTLLESELFGYKAGAFTDARRDKPGKFALAEGGTLFLDEIGDVSPAMQVKLLRVLQERVYEPLGARAPERADARVIAATNKDLKAAVELGAFRMDLFYRVNVLSVKLPPLRQRRCDIPLLCQHFVGQFNSRYGKRVEAVSPEALELLLAYDFPGNIRELENLIEHAFIFCKGQVIEPAHLPPELPRVDADPEALVLARVKTFDDLERLYIQSVLAETGGNKLAASRRLGIHKTTFFRKLKRLGLGPDH